MLQPFHKTVIGIIGITFLFVFVHCKKEVIPNTPIDEEPITNPLLLTQVEKDSILALDSASTMRILNIFLLQDSLILKSTSKNVVVKDDSVILKHLSDRMLRTVKQANGVGIAAPQVGILRNVIWVQRYDKGTSSNRPFEVYYNPIITKYSDTLFRRADGCLSVPQTAGYPNVIDSSYRAKWVEVAYYLPNGDYVEERINHLFTAHIFQHEIDHLYGIFFFERYLKMFITRFTILPADIDDYAEIIEERKFNNQ